MPCLIKLESSGQWWWPDEMILEESWVEASQALGAEVNPHSHPKQKFGKVSKGEATPEVQKESQVN